MLPAQAALRKIGGRHLGRHARQRLTGIAPGKPFPQAGKRFLVRRFRLSFLLPRFPHRLGPRNPHEPRLVGRQSDPRKRARPIAQFSSARVAQSTQQQPVRNACARSHRIGRKLFLLPQARNKTFQRAIGVLHSGEENQLLLRTRHCHLEHAQLLAHLVAVQLEGRRLARQNIIPHAGFLIRQPYTEAQLRVEQHLSPFLIKPP